MLLYFSKQIFFMELGYNSRNWCAALTDGIDVWRKTKHAKIKKVQMFLRIETKKVCSIQG